MHKTPEEIKKGLECCIESTCEPCCPYGNAANCNFAIYLLEDALAYIRQLDEEREAAIAHSGRLTEHIWELEKDIDRLTGEVDNAYNIQNEQLERIQQLEAERDAAVPVVRCKDCVNRGTSYNCPMRKLVMPVEGPGSYEDCTEDMGFCHMGKRREGGGGNA